MHLARYRAGSQALPIWLKRVLLLGVCAAAWAALAPRVWALDPPAQPSPAQQQAWERLTRTLEQDIQAFDGEAAVVIVDLARGWQYAHRADEPVAAASLVKIPILAAVMQAIAAKQLKWSTTVKLRANDQVAGSGRLRHEKPGSVWSIERLVDLMITHSDNTATNLLINRLGYKALGRSFQQMGLSQTSLVRKMMDFSRRDEGVENWTSAGDIAILLGRIYQGRLVDSASSRRALTLLKDSTYDDRIPAKLPKGTVVAHKTGLERHLCHDAGIVFTKRGDYLIVVLTNSRLPSKKAKDFIATLSADVYRYMVPKSR